MRHLQNISVWVFFVCILCSASSISQRLREVTGKSYVRVVWTRGNSDQFGFPKDNMGYMNDQTLVGFDSETGEERVLSATVQNYQRPLMSRDGSRVIYSNSLTRKTYMITWSNPGEPRVVADGITGALWYDPATSTEYAVYLSALPTNLNVGLKGQNYVRIVNLDDPSIDRIVFNQDRKLHVCAHWLCVSSDGMYIGNVWGWPTCAAYPVSPAVKAINTISTQGCWATMPYDTSYRLAILNLNHTAIKIYGSSQPGGILLDSVITGSINHIKFASYTSNIICATRGMDKVEGGTEGGYVHISRINAAFNAIEDSVAVTNTLNDGFPDLWCGDTLPNATTKNIDSRSVSSLIVPRQKRTVQIVLASGRPVVSTATAAPGVYLSFDYQTATTRPIFIHGGRVR